ncbi:Apyrase [Entamoeba marina]
MVLVVAYVAYFNDDREKFSTFRLNKQTTYPSSMPGYSTYSSSSTSFKILFVSDDDNNNKNNDENKFNSHILSGLLNFNNGQWSFTQNDMDSYTVKTTLNYNDKGNELTDIIQFYNGIYVFDEQTGVISELNEKDQEIYPRHIIADGNGNKGNGAKLKWSTIVDNILYIGSSGNEILNESGILTQQSKPYIQQIDKTGHIQYMNWEEIYKRITEALSIPEEGVVVNEAVVYAPLSDKWYFAPKICIDNLNDKQLKSCNQIIELDGQLQSTIISQYTQFDENKGIVSIKLLPFKENTMVYLKCNIIDDEQNSWIGMMDTQGYTLLEEVKIAGHKFKGIEIVPLDI